MHVRAAALIAVLFCAVTLHAQTQPTSASVQTDVTQLIKQLGSDSAEDRDLAQSKLVDMGPSVVPDLKKAASDDDDPEVRSRASAAISQMKDRDTNDVSFITIHKKDGDVNQVLTEIARQAHAQFVGYGPGINLAMPNHVLNIDADHKPFWDVMTDVCTQLNMCPVLDTPGKNSMRLFTAPRNWLAQSPHEIVGPYWIGVAGMNRTRNVDLMGPPVIDDQFSLRLIVFPEPKLAITQMSSLNLKEATDDAGNSLLPPPQAQMRFPRMMRGFRQTNHLLEVRLVYPVNPGKKITILRGEVVVVLAQDIQEFEADNVLGTPKLTNPLQNCAIQANVVRQGSDMFRVTIQCTRQGLADDQWNAIVNRANDVTLEDDQGEALTAISVAIPGTATESTFSFTEIFSRGGIQGMVPGRQLNAKVGDPRTLKWKVATSLKSVTVPVVLKDLPMP